MRILALLSLLVSVVYAHDCVHDEMSAAEREHRRATMPVSEQTYEFPDAESHKRQSFSPLRLRVDTTFLATSDAATCSYAGERITLDGSSHTCTKSEVLDTTKRNFLLYDLLPAAEAWFEKVLSVRRVSGNLVVNAYQNQCGVRNSYINVPSSYRSGGVSSTDFVIFVTGRPTTGSTIAWALHCAEDQNNRPVAGLANFGPNQISTSSSEWDEQLSTAIHEIAHAMGFSANSFDDFRQSDGVTRHSRVTQTFSERGRSVAKLVTPKVAAAVKNQFNCQSMTNPGAELEDFGGSGTAGSHLEKRLFRNEAMTGTSTANPVYSAIMLAVFEDSGWYRADYEHADRLEWGLNQGCDFAQEKCSRWSEPYFCQSRSGKGCSHDTFSKGYCNLVEYSSSLPASLQFFRNGQLGGRDQHADYCPFYDAYSNGDCRNVANRGGNAVAYGEVYGASSRCYVSTLLSERYTGDVSEQGMCYGHRCANNGQDLEIQVGDKWYRCPRNGGKVSVPGYSGTVECHVAADHCGDVFNGVPARQQHTCPGECTGRGVCSEGVCNCQPGFLGDDCSQVQCPNGCSGNGVCDAETGLCNCADGFFGDDCTDVECDPSCSNNGQCVGGRCQCPAGFGGPSCSAVIDGQACPNDCSGHGKCNEDEGTCECAEPWTGDGCAVRDCPSNCSNHGSCDLYSGTCSCHAGYASFDCSEVLGRALTVGSSVTMSKYDDELTFFHLYIADPEATLTVTLNSLDGDSDLFISRMTEFPTEDAHQWGSDSLDGQDSVTIAPTDSNFDVGMIYVGVSTLNAGAFSLSATTSCPDGRECEQASAEAVACLEGGCSSHGSCHPATGECICLAGYTGDKCEEKRVLTSEVDASAALDAEKKDKAGVSSGAVAGIAVGVLLVGILVGAVVGMMLGKKKRAGGSSSGGARGTEMTPAQRIAAQNAPGAGSRAGPQRL